MDCISLQEDSYKGQKKSTSARPFGAIAECSTSLSENLLQQGEGLMFLRRLGMVLFPPVSAIACFSLLHGYVSFGFLPILPYSMWDISVRNGESWCKQTCTIDTRYWARLWHLGR